MNVVSPKGSTLLTKRPGVIIHAPAATRAHLQSEEGLHIDFSSTWR